MLQHSSRQSIITGRSLEYPHKTELRTCHFLLKTLQILPFHLLLCTIALHHLVPALSSTLFPIPLSLLPLQWCLSVTAKQQQAQAALFFSTTSSSPYGSVPSLLWILAFQWCLLQPHFIKLQLLFPNTPYLSSLLNFSLR